MEKIDKQITLNQGGDRITVRIDNTVIDIMHGYNNSKQEEACAIINLYPYSYSKGDYRAVIFNRVNQIIHSQ